MNKKITDKHLREISNQPQLIDIIKKELNVKQIVFIIGKEKIIR
jgi:hypothetical protein